MDSAASSRPKPATLPLQTRQQFAALVDRCLARARRDSKPLAVLALTVDCVGVRCDPTDLLTVAAPEHEQAVLDALAQRLRSGVRSTDEVVQLGGHDLGVVLLSAGPTESALVAARLQRLLGSAYRMHGALLGVKLRIGEACSPGHGLTGRELVRLAGAALGPADEAANATKPVNAWVG